MTDDRIKDYTLRITQASRTGLIVVLYELAEEYLNDAKKAFAKDDHDGYRTECMRAQRVITDLRGSLDYAYELAHSLDSIYDYFIREISSAVIKNHTEGIDNVIRFLGSIRESFVKIDAECESAPVMDNAQSVYAGLTYGRGTLNENIDLNSNRGYTV